MENLITRNDLINLGFYEKEKDQFSIGNGGGILTLKKHTDIINWYVSYENCQLFITSYTVDKLTCLLKGLGILDFKSRYNNEP